MIVSVITVVKNDIKNIEKTINSVYYQSYKKIEYIIIDGKSSDGTLAVINKNKKKISKIYSGRDKNLYEAINKGIKMSKGQVVGLLHSGDVYANRHSIKKSLNLISKKKLDFVLSNLKVLDWKNNVYRNVKTSNFFKPFMLAMGIQPPHPTLFIKKNIIKKVNYYSTNFKIVGDFDFFCKIFKNNFKWGSLNLTTVLQKRGGLSDGGMYSKISMANEMALILKKIISFHLSLFLFLNCY